MVMPADVARGEICPAESSIEERYYVPMPVPGSQRFLVSLSFGESYQRYQLKYRIG